MTTYRPWVAMLGFVLSSFLMAQPGVADKADHQGEAVESILTDFSHWQASLAEGTEIRPAEFRQEGLILAKRRAVVMRQLMRENPKRALAAAIKPSLRRRLPEAIRKFVEEQVSGYGSVGQLFDCGHVTMAQSIRLNGKLYLVHSTESNSVPVGLRHNVPLRGMVLGSEIALAENPLELAELEEVRKEDSPWRRGDGCVGCGKNLEGSPRSVAAKFAGRILPLCRREHFSLIRLTGAIAGLEGGSSGTAPGPSPDWTQGSKRLLYIVTQYSGQGSPPTSRGAAEAALAQVAQYFGAQSYQKTALTSVVTDLITAPQPASYYASFGLGQLYNDAVVVARAAGWDADDYDFVFIRHAGGPGGAGVGLVGQKGAWVQTDSWSVLAHELGHNYGLFHANGWRPKTSFPSGPGDTVEYADVYDVMGPNRGSFNSYEKSVLHWLPNTTIRRITNSGIYRLSASDVPNLVSNNLYALKVRKDIRDFWLDYRGELQTGEFAPFALNGLQVRWPEWSQSRGGSTLLDMTPGTPRQFDDGPLALGHTFSDAEAGVHLTVVDRSRVSEQWLDVVVQFPSAGSNHSPTATLTASTTNVLAGDPITFSVTASDLEGDSLAFGWESSVAGYSTPLVVSSNSPLLTYSWTAPGEFEVRCKVSDMKGGVTTGRIVVTVANPAGFSISGSITSLTGAPVRNVRVFSLPSSVSASEQSYVTHAGYRSALTDDSGKYVLLNLSAGQQVVRVLPTSTHTFVATNSSGAVTVGPDFEGMDFVSVAKPLAAIRGIVRDGGQTVSNVVLQLAGQTITSQSDGSFVFSNLPPSAYVLKSTGDGQFVHSGSPIYLDGLDVTNAVLYRVLYPLKGSVPGGIGLVYVGTGEPGRSVLALPGSGGFSGNWEYELRVPRGLWNLEALCDGFTLVPNGFTNPISVAGSDNPFYASEGVQPTAFSNLNFSAVAGTTYSIRGRITSAGNPVVGANLSIGIKTAISDSLGSYAFGGLSAGSYTVGANLSGYTFGNAGFSNPVSVGPDATNINFLAFLTTTNPPSITTQPQTQIVNLGANATFSVSASGSPPLAYQWYFNTLTPIAGATNSALTVTNVQEDDGGVYSVVVSNGPSVTSSNALLSVNHLPVTAVPVLERYAFNNVKMHISEFIGSDPDGDSLSLYSAGPGSAAGGTVTTNMGWVIYTPPPGFTNADSFPFAVSDGRGGIGFGTATVIVTFDNVVPQNFRAEILGNGSVRLIFDGIQNRTYSIEFTENLESPWWQKLANVTADEHGVFFNIDSLPNGSPQRFYRAAWP